MGRPLVGFQQITKSWSTRRIAATAVLLACIGALTILAAVGWRIVDEAAIAAIGEARARIIGHFVAGGVALVVLITIIGIALERALVAHAYHHRDLPARPEFYDYRVGGLANHLEELAGAALSSMTFTVFDTETTGLRPSQGDEIISIAGVRIEGGEVRREVSFERLVNPGFSIPTPSIRFHGITDDMVTGAPAIDEVLPDFHDFVGDSILVAHNAAFDMRFLELKEKASGTAFHQVVLDTLLLSVFLDRDAEAHTLDAVARRAGIMIEGRHTALGDALATAEIFLKLLPRLKARGIATLGQVIDVGNEMEAVRKLQTRF